MLTFSFSALHWFFCLFSVIYLEMSWYQPKYAVSPHYMSSGQSLVYRFKNTQGNSANANQSPTPAPKTTPKTTPTPPKKNTAGTKRKRQTSPIAKKKPTKQPVEKKQKQKKNDTVTKKNFI